MMGDYNTLIASLVLWMENDTVELSTALPDVVRFAHQRLNRDLIVQAQDAQTSGTTLQAGNANFPRPDNLIQPRLLNIRPVGGGPRSELRRVDYGFIVEFWPDDTLTGVPKYYALEDAGTYVVAPTPDHAYPYTLVYKGYLPDLSVSSPTNWYTDHAYDALFAACMAYAGRFVQDNRQTSIVTQWEAVYKDAIATINAVDQRGDRDDYDTPTIDGSNR